MVYYNEIEPYAVQWLQNLIAADLIAGGIVDSRPIQEVTGDDLIGFTQCHFFAGIGGWSYALRLAGWPDDKEVWTGSCPCQPFSVAGKRKGTADERHLWPDFARLIRERSPSVVFGEQVASKDGRTWLNGVRSDLEGMAYGVGAADLCAAGVNAPHIRQRLYWVAESEGEQSHRAGSTWEGRAESTNHGAVSEGRDGIRQRQESTDRLGSPSENVRMADLQRPRLETRGFEPPRNELTATERSGYVSWSDFDITCCGDGKSRRIESGTFPLAHGVPGRVGKLRAYGNAIVPQVAAEFIASYAAVSR